MCAGVQLRQPGHRAPPSMQTLPGATAAAPSSSLQGHCPLHPACGLLCCAGVSHSPAPLGSSPTVAGRPSDPRNFFWGPGGQSGTLSSLSAQSLTLEPWPLPPSLWPCHLKPSSCPLPPWLLAKIGGVLGGCFCLDHHLLSCWPSYVRSRWSGQWAPPSLRAAGWGRKAPRHSLVRL